MEIKIILLLLKREFAIMITHFLNYLSNQKQLELDQKFAFVFVFDTKFKNIRWKCYRKLGRNKTPKKLLLSKITLYNY